MRPLPSLPDLAPAQPVYNPAQDDLLAFITPDISLAGQLLQSSESDIETANAGLNSASSQLDQIDSTITDIWNVFDSLSTDLDSVDLTGDIATYSALDDALLGALDSWAPDLASIGISFLTSLLPSITGLFSGVFNSIWSSIFILDDQVGYLVNIIGNALAASQEGQIFAQFFPI